MIDVYVRYPAQGPVAWLELPAEAVPREGELYSDEAGGRVYVVAAVHRTYAYAHGYPSGNAGRGFINFGRSQVDVFLQPAPVLESPPEPPPSEPVPLPDDEACMYFRAGRKYREENGPSPEGPPIEVAKALGWDAWRVHVWAWGWQAAEKEIDLGLARKAWEGAEAALKDKRREHDERTRQWLDVAAALEALTTTARDLSLAAFDGVSALQRADPHGTSAAFLERTARALLPTHEEALAVLKAQGRGPVAR